VPIGKARTKLLETMRALAQKAAAARTKQDNEFLEQLRELGRDRWPVMFEAAEKLNSQALETMLELLCESGPESLRHVANLITQDFGRFVNLSKKYVAKLGDPAIPVLKEFEDAENDRLRLWVASSLGTRGLDPKLALPSLAELTADRNVDVRYRSLLSIRTYAMEAATCLPAIIKALDDPEKKVRLTAIATGVWASRNQATFSDVLVSRLTKQGDDFELGIDERVGIADALRRAPRGEAYRKALLALVDDPEPTVSAKAIFSMTQRGGFQDEDLPKLVERLKACSSVVAKEIMAALGRYASLVDDEPLGEAEAVLLKYLEADDQTLRRSAAGCLSKVPKPGKDTIEALKRLLQEDDFLLQRSAILSLRRLDGSPELVELMEHVSRTAKNRRIRQMAESAVTELRKTPEERMPKVPEPELSVEDADRLVAEGWPWLSSEAPQMVLQTGHSLHVLCVAISVDGKALATAGGDNAIKLWDIGSGQLRGNLTGHFNTVYALAYSPDGAFLASGSSDQTVRLWDTQTGRLRKALVGHGKEVRSVVFSVDGRWLATGGEDGLVIVWDAKSWQMKQRILARTEQLSSVYAVAFDPAGKTVYGAVDDRRIMAWSVESGEILASFPRKREHIRALAASVDGSSLFSGHTDGTVRSWDTKTAAMRWEIKPQARLIRSLAVSPCGRMVAVGCESQSVKLVESESGEIVRSLEGQQRSLGVVAFSPDGKWVVGASFQSPVEMWETDSGERKRTFKLPALRDAGFLRMAIPPDGSQVVRGGPGTSLTVWNLRDATVRFIPTDQKREPRFVAFSPDGQTLATAASWDKVRLWDCKTWELKGTIDERQPGLRALSFTPDGRMLCVGRTDGPRPEDKGGVQLWDIGSGNLVRTLVAPRKSPTADTDFRNIVFAPDGNTLLTTNDDGTVRSWDYRDGKVTRTVNMHSRWVNTMVFSPDGKLAISCGGDRAVKLWNAEDWSELKTMKPHGFWVSSVCLSPDGNLFASVSGDHSVKLWESKTGSLVRTLTGHRDHVTSAVFLPDGKRLVTEEGDGTIRVWNVADGRLLVSMCLLPPTPTPKTSDGDAAPEKERPVNWLAFTPDGYFKGSEGADAFIRWRQGDKLLPASALPAFRRPDLVEAALR